MEDDNTKLELARRAVNCKRWRWTLGMRNMAGQRYTCGPSGAIDWMPETTDALTAKQHMFALPDLDDAATVGCLLKLVREAVSDSGAYAARYATCWPRSERWRVSRHNKRGFHFGYGWSEAEALVAALEAAP